MTFITIYWLLSSVSQVQQPTASGINDSNIPAPASLTLLNVTKLGLLLPSFINSKYFSICALTEVAKRNSSISFRVVHSWGDHAVLSCFIHLCRCLIDSLILASWIDFLKILMVQLAVASILCQPSLACVEMFVGLVPHALLYALVFMVFEKINKERFIINLTNQQTRKLFSEINNTGIGLVLVNQDGMITFFNKVFKRLMLERLQFETLPTNIISICKDVPHSIRSLENLFFEAVNFKKKSPEPFRKTIELRIPKQLPPEIGRVVNRRSSSIDLRSNNDNDE